MNETFLHGAWRTVTFLAGLLVALAGLYVLLHATGVVPPLSLGSLPRPALPATHPLVLHLDLQELPLRYGLLWMVGGLLSVVLGGLLTILAFAHPEGTGQQVVLRGQDGERLYGGGRVSVSMQSLRALVVSEAERIEGVREMTPRLRLKRSGWYLECNVTLAPTAQLPEIVQRLKPRLQETLEHHTGLPVAQVDIRGSLGLVDARRRVR